MRRRRVSIRKKLAAGSVVLLVVALVAVRTLDVQRMGGRTYDFAPGAAGDLFTSESFTLDCARSQDRRELEPCLYSFETNSHGFRGAELELGPDRELIMIMGDGYAFGTALQGGHTTCDVLNRMSLEERGGRPLVCANAGVPGYAIVDGHAMLRERAGALEPEVVVWIVAWDDVWEMIRPEPLRSLLKCVDESLLCQLHFSRLRHEHNYFYPYQEAVEANPEDPTAVFFDLLERYLAEARAMDTLVRSWGGTLVFMTGRFEQPALRRALQEEGYPIIVLNEELGREPSHTVDGHWDAATHAEIASLLGRWVQAEIPPPTRSEAAPAAQPGEAP